MTYSLKHLVGYFLITIVSILAFGVHTAQANSVIRTGDKVSIGEDQLIEGDFYSAAGKINLSGNVKEDALIIGSQVTINGDIAQDAILIGGTVDVYGNIGDDLRIISGETTIAEPVMGNVLVIGGMLTVLSSASVSGDVILLTGQATIEGSVGGDILGRSSDLRIDAPVAGNVSVTVNSLTLGDKANITGSVQYVSRELAVQAQGATVGGGLVRNDPVIPIVETSVRSALIPVLIILFSVLAWYLISRKSLTHIVNKALNRSFKPAAFGFAAIILTPFAIVILSVSVIGMLVGMTLFFLYASLLLLGLIAVPALIGQALMKMFNQPIKQLTLLSLVVGVIGMVLLSVLPIVGALVLLGVLVLTVGAMIDLLVHSTLR